MLQSPTIKIATPEPNSSGPELLFAALYVPQPTRVVVKKWGRRMRLPLGTTIEARASTISHTQL